MNDYNSDNTTQKKKKCKMSKTYDKFRTAEENRPKQKIIKFEPKKTTFGLKPGKKIVRKSHKSKDYSEGITHQLHVSCCKYSANERSNALPWKKAKTRSN